MKKVAIFLSGASTKIGMLAGAVITLVLNYNVKVKVYVGTSSGALLSLIFAIGLFKKAKEKVLNFTLKDIFKESPNSLWGLLKGLNRLFYGYYHLFDQSQLLITLKELISIEEFNNWKKDPNKPEAYIGVYNVETRAKEYINVKELDYEEALKVVLASASIPLAAEPVKINDNHYLDGGVRDHIGGAWYVREKHHEIRECISVFSRPEVFVQNEKAEPFKILPPTKLPSVKNLKRALSMLLELYDVMLNEISKNDEIETDMLCEKYKIKHTKIFAPHKLSTGTYETSLKMNKENYDYGVSQTINVMSKYK